MPFLKSCSAAVYTVERDDDRQEANRNVRFQAKTKFAYSLRLAQSHAYLAPTLPLPTLSAHRDMEFVTKVASSIPAELGRFPIKLMLSDALWRVRPTHLAN